MFDAAHAGYACSEAIEKFMDEMKTSDIELFQQ